TRSYGDWSSDVCSSDLRPHRFARRIGLLAGPSGQTHHGSRGNTPIIDCSDRHDRISVIIVITLSPQALRVGLHFMLLGKDENFQDRKSTRLNSSHRTIS